MIAIMNERLQSRLFGKRVRERRRMTGRTWHQAREVLDVISAYPTSIEPRGDLLVYTIEATAFLRYMVRNLVGTLVELGRGERTPQAFAELLEARDRIKAGKTAPPHGLYLIEVKY